MATVLLLMGDLVTRRRLAAALGGAVHIEEARTVRDAWLVLRRRACSACVLDPVDGEGAQTHQFARQATRDFPRMALIGHVSRDRAQTKGVLALARAGVHDLLYTEDADLQLFVRQLLQRAAQQALYALVWPTVAPWVPARTAPIVSYGLQHAESTLSVNAIARALGVTRKTVAQRCALDLAPEPRVIMAWCRLLAVAHRLESNGRSIESITYELDFPSPNALRNLMVRQAGVQPSALRALGGLHWLTQRFVAVMRGEAGVAGSPAARTVARRRAAS